VRVALEEPATDVLLDEIKQLGCLFEGANRRYIAIDVPPGIALQKIADFLTENDICWEYADPTYEEASGERPDQQFYRACHRGWVGSW
jgi:hypothetical protein